MRSSFCACAIAIYLAAQSASAAVPLAPLAPIHPFVTDYYGTKVIDDYRWMEVPGSPELAAYMKGQNDYTRAILDSIPGRAPLLKEIAAAENAGGSIEALIQTGGRDFYTEVSPGKNTAKLFVRDDRTGTTKLLIDPNKYGNTNQAEAINFFQPSEDGRYVAYGISNGGSEADTLRVTDAVDMKDQGIAITRVDGDNNTFLPVWWLPDDSFVYYRLQKLGPKDDQSGHFLKSRVWLHHLGQHPNGNGDVPVFGYGVDKSVAVAPDQDALVTTFPGSNYAFGVLTQNESNNVINDIYVTPIAALEAGRPVWRRLIGIDDDITAFDVVGDEIFLLTYKNAPRYKIIETNLAAPNIARAKTVMKQGDAVINAIGVGEDALYVTSSLNGFSQLSRLALKGGTVGAAKNIPLPFAGTVHDLVANESATGAIFSLESWTRSALWYHYNPATGKLADTGLQKPVAANAGLVSKEVSATSYDGTQIPLSIIMKAGVRRDGKNPTLLIGYGSYGITLTPRFIRAALPLFDRGGIVAVAHVRGGGWYGEDWHKAGMKLTKINTIFDYIACAQYLVDRHYTSPAYLAGLGASAGGITIGGAIEWRPRLFAAAIDSHGMTDALRSEFSPNGPPNIEEFGSVTTASGFHDLYAMSAYVHVRNGVKYPAVLLQTGANDPRVEPWEVTKMAARLQEASTSGKPILLSVSYDSGHGIGDTRAQIDSAWADDISFMLWQMGVPEFQPKPQGRFGCRSRCRAVLIKKMQ